MGFCPLIPTRLDRGPDLQVRVVAKARGMGRALEFWSGAVATGQKPFWLFQQARFKHARTPKVGLIISEVHPREGLGAQHVQFCVLRWKPAPLFPLRQTRMVDQL